MKKRHCGRQAQGTQACALPVVVLPTLLPYCVRQKRSGSVSNRKSTVLAVGGAAKSGHPPYRGRPHGFGCDCPWLGHAALHVRLAHCGRLSCMLSSVIDEWGPWAAQ